MRTRHRQETDGLGVALGIHLSIYSLVFVLFSAALYSLLQPKQAPNPGLAAYTPPPGTVISYEMPPRLLTQHGQPPQLAELPPTPEADETTGRSVQTVEQVPEPERAVTRSPPKPPKIAAHPPERGNPWGARAEPYPAYRGDLPF